MNVTVIHVKPAKLEEIVQLEKNAGRRILALSPSKFKTLKSGMTVTEYVLVTR